MYIVETIVCSGKKGKDARLRRKLQARQELKRRQDGCIAAWIGTGKQDSRMFLVQSVFTSLNVWKKVSDEISNTLDKQDGGLEGLMIGPPLVGMFEIAPGDLNFMNSQ